MLLWGYLSLNVNCKEAPALHKVSSSKPLSSDTKKLKDKRNGRRKNFMVSIIFFFTEKIKHNNVGKKSVIFMAEFMRLAKVSFKMVC